MAASQILSLSHFPETAVHCSFHFKSRFHCSSQRRTPPHDGGATGCPPRTRYAARLPPRPTPSFAHFCLSLPPLPLALVYSSAPSTVTPA